MIYSIVDEAYCVTLCSSIFQIVTMTRGDFNLEDGSVVSKNSLRAFFKANPKGTLYLYRGRCGPEGEPNWKRDWYYRVERHG